MHSSKIRAEISSQAMNEKPNVYLGKNGKTRQFINELHRCFKNREVVKIKIQKRYRSREAQKKIINEIAHELEAELIEIRGRSFILYKPFQENNDK